MAGETEDYVSFQAESLPTGSISFGRFEVESLSWERRSSFSHNRYLEEVEKYSTPGSVTQKRAILEAHFKKKGLLHQDSPEKQNEAECQTTENDIDRHTSYFEEFVDHDNVGQPEFAWYDETPAVSDDYEVMVCEQEETSPSEFPIEPTPCSNERVVSPTVELSEHDETLQPQSEHDAKLSNKDNLCVVVEQEPDNKAVIVEELLEKRDVSSKSRMVEKKNAPSLKKTQKASLRVKEAIEQKTAKTKSTQLPVQQNLRKSSIEKNSVSSGKLFSKSTGKVERENTLRTKSVKQSPLRSPTPTSSYSKNLKLEASENLKAKVRQENRSEKDIRAKKGGITPHSISGKSETDVGQPTNRPKQVADSAKEDVKQSGPVFNFKCDERAEKRKEYYMKLEEKLHAKEVEMNEIQARTEEETEAKIKQFRRSLNFKATPMPSFYHEAVPRVPEGKKKVATPAKPENLRNKCTSPTSRTSLRDKSPAFSKASNRESPSIDEPNQASESAKKSEAGKKERNKLNAQQRQQGEGSGRVRRGSMGRKVMKGGIVGGSAAVHVAS